MPVDEEKLLYDRISDKIDAVERDWCVRFTSFLDERQQALAEKFLKQSVFGNFLLYGGFDEAGRKILGLFPEYQEPLKEEFPILPVTMYYREQDKPRHQDILGSLMGLNIKRELIGDILIGERYAVLYLIEPAYNLVLNELTKVGRVGVSVKPELPDILPKAYELQPISGTVSSLRLDCLVALLTNQSREKAVQLIRNKQVSVNFFESEEPAHPVLEKDIFSIRGYGRFILSSVGGTSKKGRLHLLCHKYC